MKKKLTVAISLLLLLAVAMTLLVGCDEIFKRNDQRDMTQVVAKVTYHSDELNRDFVDYVYKFEMASSFNNYAYYYVNYYGMTYEAAAKYVAQSLAQQRLLVMFAKEQVALLLGNVAVDKIDDLRESHGANGLLNENEYNHAVGAANDSLLSSLKSLINDSIDEDEYNQSSSNTDNDTDKEEEEDDEEIKDPVYVYFNSNGGSDVERVRVSKGAKLKAPDDPTRDGYTFYGWYLPKYDEQNNIVRDEDDEVILDKEWDFDNDVVDARKTLYAKWEKYLAPRTEMPEAAEEEDDYDPDEETVQGKVETKFFKKSVDDLLADLREDDEEFAKDLEDAKIKEYISDCLEDLKTNLKNNLYASSMAKAYGSESEDAFCYDYYLIRQLESALTEKMERMLGASVTVSEAEIEAEFNRIVARNKEMFGNSDSAYSSALTSNLTGTYYHPDMDKGSYGFVTNILLRLDDEKLEELTDLYAKDPRNKDYIVKRRNALLSEMEISVSNPNYDSTAVVEDADGNEIELRDPMTDPKNPYNNVGKDDDTNKFVKTYEFKTKEKDADGNEIYQNDYNHILNFQKNEKTGKYEIVFQATEHPAMAYLLEKWPAFDREGKTGIIHQIYNSFEQVNAFVESKDLTIEQGIYWLREIANTWAYLVGDDTGAVTSSSNNNGLGYLITPEGEDSSYLKDFTAYARNVVAKGTGKYTASDAVDTTPGQGDFAPAGSEGALNGNGKVFVAADSFIDSGSTSNAYAGVFVLLCTYKVWDNDLYKQLTTDDANPDGNRLDATNGTLPLDYIFTYAEKQDDVKTIKQLIEQTLSDAKKSNVYNLKVNELGSDTNPAHSIVYYEKAYKSLWKDLD